MLEKEGGEGGKGRKTLPFVFESDVFEGDDYARGYGYVLVYIWERAFNE